jgi:hypothetical protein
MFSAGTLALWIIIFILSIFILLSPIIWIIYFCLEIIWIVLINLFIRGTYRAFVSYFIFNALTGFLLLISFTYGNGTLVCFTLLLKIGFFPFIYLLFMFILNASYIYLLVDILMKYIYFFIFSHFLLLMSTFCAFEPVYFMIFLMINFTFFSLFAISRNLISLKYLILISGLTNYALLVLLILYLTNSFSLFIFSYLSLYKIISSIVI